MANPPSTRSPNRLIHETSPYLLQHAHNPVDWYPWGEEALQLAKDQDKPLLLSPSMLQPTYRMPSLPPRAEFETPSILKAAALAHRHLAELKGRAISVPNPEILIDTLTLQEARASCEIENIVTTQDDLYRAAVFPDSPWNPAVKEVTSYRSAVKLGFHQLQENDHRLTNDLLIDIYRIVKSRTDGYRVRPGTVISNTFTGEIVHVPPQDPAEVLEKMDELTSFANDDSLSGLDPLVKMAVIHHQFESIHPFEDGNG